MNPSELREKSLEDLESEGQALSEQIFRLRFQKATGQLENRTKIRQIRRDLARVKTIMAERRQPRQ